MEELANHVFLSIDCFAALEELFNYLKRNDMTGSWAYESNSLYVATDLTLDIPIEEKYGGGTRTTLDLFTGIPFLTVAGLQNEWYFSITTLSGNKLINDDEFPEHTKYSIIVWNHRNDMSDLKFLFELDDEELKILLALCKETLRVPQMRKMGESDFVDAES